MATLGITGSFSDLAGEFLPAVPEWLFHDSAAAVVVDGQVVAAVEEERLNRIKHTNKFPSLSVPACLEIAGLQAADIDDVAFFFGEDYAENELNQQYLTVADAPVCSPRELLITRLQGCLGHTFAPSDIHFVQHHIAHGFGALSDSGFASSLVVVLDGNGEAQSISVFRGREGSLTLLAEYPVAVSLGHLYLNTLPLLGFRRFDEYKVMGLAPYGDPEPYRSEFREFMSLLPDGRFELDSLGLVEQLLRRGFRPRRRGEPIRAEDADLSAALQQTLEDVQLHILRHWADESGERNLCLSGGVAQNSSANGRLLKEKVFSEVFVHPASHDAGAAAGAAQYRYAQVRGTCRGKRLSNAFLGPSLGTRRDVHDEVRRWDAFVEAEAVEEVDEEAVGATLIAGGGVIGWARGRSEFGPRALGHRSILADPSRAENRDRVNALIKKREGFRPFAPVVLIEHAASIFELTEVAASLDFMSYVVQVRPEWRERLPAVTHVDGSARVQTIASEQNASLWRLVREFERCTGLPVVLNTSFNNFAEPIVQSARDVVRCLVTTDLDVVIMPGQILRRRPDLEGALLNGLAKLHPAAELRKAVRARAGRPVIEHVATFEYGGAREAPLSAALFEVLCSHVEGVVPVKHLGVAAGTSEGTRLAKELMQLWEHRVIDISPLAD